MDTETIHIVKEDVYALAKKLHTSPFRVLSMAFDAYACNKNILMDDYSNFRVNEVIPQYLQSYVIVHMKDEEKK